MNIPDSTLATPDKVQAALQEVVDPELGVNIVDLGLVYGVDVTDGCVRVTMTLTTPGCPLHASMSEAAERAIRVLVPGVRQIAVDLVWDPPWSPERITHQGRKELGWA